VSLNPSQHRVAHGFGNMLAVAGPGSGKTKTIITKIGVILEADRKNKVGAVTFTNDTATEMRDRLVKEFGPDVQKRVLLGTFHKLSIDHLRRHKMLGKIATPGEQRSFLRRALANTNSELQYEEATKLFESYKCASSPNEADLLPFIRNYNDMLERNHVVDLYDVMSTCATKMRDGTLETLPVTHLLVDEFQDSDEIQFIWMMAHASRGIPVTIVGDDDQSIYAWRRALGYKGMIDFVEQTGAEIIPLGENYRSHSEILGPADRLIRHNAGQRVEKDLVAKRGPGGSTLVYAVSAATRPDGDEHDQVALQTEFLVPHILESILPDDQQPGGRLAVQPGEWAILARTNFLLDSVEAVLDQYNIRSRRAGASFWDKDYINTYLQLLVSIETMNRSGVDHALAYVGTSDDALRDLHKRIPGATMSSFFERGFDDYGDIAKTDVEHIRALQQLLVTWRQDALFRKIPGTDTPMRAVNQAIDAAASFLTMNMRSGNFRDRVSRHLTKAGDILKRRTGTLVARVQSVQKPKGNDDPASVGLYTMHSCKGLEFGNTAIVGADKDIIPSLGEGSTEVDERRLFYVAMTRAKNRLFILHSPTKDTPYIAEAGLASNPVVVYPE
jgi:DNA helicase-2/ATP-dependent DNA helicase PcrA